MTFVVFPESEPKYPRCPDCGEEVKLISRPGRTREMRVGVHVPVPADYPLPECVSCGQPSMSLVESEPLDLLLRLGMQNGGSP